MDKKYHVLNRVAFVVDNYDRKQGYTECEGYRFPVYSFDYLNNINIDDYLILITSEYYEEVYRQIKGMFPDHINTTIYHYADARIHYYNYFSNKFKEKPLENKIIFCSGARKAYNIESGEFDDNSLALFEYMLENKLNMTYQLVWVVLHPEKYTQKYSQYENVYFCHIDGLNLRIRMREEHIMKIFVWQNISFYTSDRHCNASTGRADTGAALAWARYKKQSIVYAR